MLVRVEDSGWERDGSCNGQVDEPGDTPLSIGRDQKLQGHFQYYGVSDTWDYLLSYREKVIWLVSRWIHRRSQRSMSPTEFYEVYLPRHPIARPKRLTNLFAR